MSESDAELARDLGFLEAYTLGLGTMIGAGIFVLPGIVAEAAGPGSMISFTIGGIVALLAALSLSELATGMPKAGGSYYYINHALGSFFGTIVGFGMWAGLMFATAFYMLGFGQYLLNQPSDAIAVVLAALAMSSLLVAVNYRGVKETGSLQNVIVIFLLALIGLFVLVGLGAVDMASFQNFPASVDGHGSWAAVGITAGTVFVTFIGFEVIATSAEEIKNPGRNLPLSMIAAVVTPTILYVLVMFVSTGAVSVEDLAASDVPVGTVAEVTAGRFGEVLGTVAFWVMIVGAVLATISSANASILSAARVNFAMGRDKILTDWLNRIHTAFRTPYRAILATGAVILALIASPLPIDTLADVAAFMFLLTYALVHVAVVVLRRAEPAEYNPDFRIPSLGYPVVPILGFLGCVAVMVQMGDATAWLSIPETVFGVNLPLPAFQIHLAPLSIVQGIGLLIIALSVGWWAYHARDEAESTTLLGEAVAPEAPAVEDGDVYRVVVPVSNPETQRPLLRYAAASAAAHDNAELVAMNVIEVPPQTSPAQVEEERVQRQQKLLDSAKAVAEDLDVPLRTRELVGRSAADAVLSVVEDEEADQVVLGWAGPRNRRDVLFGTTIDPVLERAPCEVSLVKEPTETPGDIVVLAGQGPNAVVAAERAAELTRTFEDTSLTLLSVQPPGEETGDAVDAGSELIETVAERAGLADDEYTVSVVENEDVRAAIREAVVEYDTACVGATGTGTVAQTLFGSIPNDVVGAADGTVLLARARRERERTLREAIAHRLLDSNETEELAEEQRQNDFTP